MQMANLNSLTSSLRKDFIYAEGKSKISDHFVKEGHEMRTIEETMSIINLENNHRKINMLEEIKILKAASSRYLVNDVINGQSDPVYRLIPSVSDLNSNGQQPRRLADRRDIPTTN
jgi:hypothetical protein